MAHVLSDGVRIYFEVDGNGPPLVLAHGFMSSLEVWRRNGAIAALRESYRLILIDARGHGRSEKPHDPTVYSRRQLAADVIAVLDDLGLATAHFYGYSMAGFGFFLARDHPDRVRSLAIGGAEPFAHPEARAMTEQFASLLRLGMEAALPLLEQVVGPLPPANRIELLANDPEAMTALSLGALTDEDLAPDLPSMATPVLLICGELDVAVIGGAKAAADLLPEASFVALPGVGHTEPDSDFGLVESHLRSFLKRVAV